MAPDRKPNMPPDEPTVPLREFISEKFSALEKSTELSRQAMEKRLDSMNEFRQQLKDQADRLLPRAEYTLQHDRVLEDVRGLRESRAELAGKANQTAVNIALVIALVGLALAVIGLILKVKGTQ